MLAEHLTHPLGDLGHEQRMHEQAGGVVASRRQTPALPVDQYVTRGEQVRPVQIRVCRGPPGHARITDTVAEEHLQPPGNVGLPQMYPLGLDPGQASQRRCQPVPPRRR